MDKEDFYAPRQIVYNRKTALWVLRNLGCLRAGSWPTEDTSYIDPLTRKAVSHKAPFITAVECAAELTSRLEMCGTDGLILLAIETWGETEASLAKYFGMPEWSVFKRYKKALIYVSSGPNRRWHDTKKRPGETYQEFKRRK